MIAFYGILLVLAVGTVRDAHGDKASPAVTAATDEPGNVYRERSRNAIQVVLARREFADLHADPYAFWRIFLGWLDGFFGRIGNALRALPEWLFWVIIVWMILTLLAILAHLIYTLVMLLRGTLSPLRSDRKDGRISGELLGIKDLDFDTVLAEARRLLTAGDWPAATRYFYVAAILWLDRQGWIAFKKSKTNRDYIDELARRVRIQGLFRRLTADFEPIVYGGAAPTRSTIQGIATTVEGLLHEPAGASAS